MVAPAPAWMGYRVHLPVNKWRGYQPNMPTLGSHQQSRMSSSRGFALSYDSIVLVVWCGPLNYASSFGMQISKISALRAHGNPSILDEHSDNCCAVPMPCGMSIWIWHVERPLRVSWSSDCAVGRGLSLGTWVGLSFHHSMSIAAV